MTKKEKTIKYILQEADIHHNIRINYSKLPQEDSTLDILEEGGQLVSQFCDDWQYEKMNDSGNRNLCACKDKMKRTDDLSICDKHDLWHCYTTGRMGATLYWDKYWKESKLKYYEYDLEEMELEELETILEEMFYFKKAVADLMISFYAQCKDRVKEIEADKEREDMEEKLYQKTMLTVKNNGYIKRLITDIL